MTSSRLILLALAVTARLANGIRGNGVIEQPKGANAPGLVPESFLMIASPSRARIVYTRLQNFRSADSQVHPLVDQGLVEPKGLAFDRRNGHLYVADSGAQKIYRYTILTQMSGSTPSLVTSGMRLTVLEGFPVESVTIDHDGHLFYTNPVTNNINMIDAAVIDRIGKGVIRPSSLTIKNGKLLAQQAKAAKAKAVKLAKAGENLPTGAPDVLPYIQQMYMSSVNPHVSAPASLWADGNDLYWTNTQNGVLAGSVVRGLVHPNVTLTQTGAPAPFPADALSNVSNAAYGLAKARDTLVFTRDGPFGVGVVTAIQLSTGISVDFITGLATPKGIAYDNDNTMYVADESVGKVWSFPIGRMMENVPLRLAANMPGAAGVAVLTGHDPCFRMNKMKKVAALQVAQTGRNSQHQKHSEAKRATSFLRR